MNPEVITIINEVKRDNVHGAGWISRRALDAMKVAILESTTQDVSTFVTQLRGVGRELLFARPSMIPVANLVSQLIHQIEKSADKRGDVSNLHLFALEECQRLVNYSEQASLGAAIQGAESIPAEGTVMTCSYSSTVCHTFKLAWGMGKRFEVIAVSSDSPPGYILW